VILATDDFAAMLEQTREVAAELRALRARAADGRFRDRAEELEEFAAFLEWLEDGHFIFLGYRRYDLIDHEGERALAIDADSGLGLLRKIERSNYREPVPLSKMTDELRDRVVDGRTLIVTKTNAESTVRRAARMDYIGVKKLSDDWQVLGEHRFLGLLNTKAYTEPADQVPILRMKLRQVLELDGSLPGSHDYKQITVIFNSLPRADLFWADAAAVHREVRAIMSLEQERGVRLLVRPDPLGRGLSVTVRLPRDHFNAEVRQRVQQHLTRVLDARHVDYQLSLGEDEAQARLHFFLTTDGAWATWTSRASSARSPRSPAPGTTTCAPAWCRPTGEREGGGWPSVTPAPSPPATRPTPAPRAPCATSPTSRRVAEGGVHVDVVQPIDDPRGEEVSHVRVYHHGEGMVLSDVLPILEDLGFRVLEQVSYRVRDGNARSASTSSRCRTSTAPRSTSGRTARA
jgi:glutamate dehydrogenase